MSIKSHSFVILNFAHVYSRSLRFASLDSSIELFIEVQENQNHCKEDKTGRSLIDRLISKTVFLTQSSVFWKIFLDVILNSVSWISWQSATNITGGPDVEYD